MKYRKQSVKNYKKLGMYPVYIEDVYGGREPFKIVGIRKNRIELKGDFSGGTHVVSNKGWFKDKKCFVVKEVCPETLKGIGCQVRNVYCCGGGSVVTEHVDKYWENLID